jgi:hypothetical protein
MIPECAFAFSLELVLVRIVENSDIPSARDVLAALLVRLRWDLVVGRYRGGVAPLGPPP